MAALNGALVYRAAGFEPMKGSLPDYLPRMLEFMAVCDDWAVETMLDGFGPEFEKIVQASFRSRRVRYAPLAAVALAPLKRGLSASFQGAQQASDLDNQANGPSTVSRGSLVCQYVAAGI